MPSQNTGMLAPKSEVTALTRSSHECGRIAEATPSDDPAERREQERAGRQHERRLEAAEHFVQHGPLHPERAPEVAADHVAHPPEVLDVERLGQPELEAQPRQVFLGRLGAQHDLGRVARREVEHHEDDDRDAQQDGNEQEEPARDIAPHPGGLT